MGGGGGGGGGGAPNPNITPELGNIYKGFSGQTLPAFHSFVQGEPLLNQAQGGALADWSAINAQLLPVLQSGGALTPEQNRDVTQATRAGFAARGNVMGNQALGSELLNRDQYRQQRFQTAIGESTQGINQLLGVEGAETGAFSSLVNPIYGLFENAQNAATQLQVANQNKQGGIAGGGISAIGSIIPAMIGAFSDERIKEKIYDTGETSPEGIPIKTWEYSTDPSKRRYIGFTAQDVEERDPAHVLTEPMSGLKFVSPKYRPLSLGS